MAKSANLGNKGINGHAALAALLGVAVQFK